MMMLGLIWERIVTLAQVGTGQIYYFREFINLSSINLKSFYCIVIYSGYCCYALWKLIFGMFATSRILKILLYTFHVCNYFSYSHAE